MILENTDQYSQKIEERKYGKLISRLRLLQKTNDLYKAEKSIVISSDCFSYYRQTNSPSEELVDTTYEELKELKIGEADFFQSYHENCLVDTNPITIRVTKTNIRNALTAIYERWFDGKAYAQRKIRHLEDKDTYPAILIQPHQSQEFTMITRHPQTGKLMRRDDGRGIVHCSSPILNEDEEKAIEEIDLLLDTPCKIYYYRDKENGILIVRRVETYPMTADARILYNISKYDEKDPHTEQLLCRIDPDDISALSFERFMLAGSELQFIGLYAPTSYATKGQAVFPWTSSKKLTDTQAYVFLSNEMHPEDLELLKMCQGAIFSSGGLSSHGPSVCRGLGINYILGCDDLVVDRDSRHAYAILDFDESVTQKVQEIMEGDLICMVERKWSLGGEIIPNDQYVPKSSEEVRQKLRGFLKPFTEEEEMKKLPVNTQIHIAKLIHSMKELGWEP